MAYLFMNFGTLVEAIKAYSKETPRPSNGVYEVRGFGLHTYKDWSQNPEGQVNLYKEDVPIASFTFKNGSIHVHDVDNSGYVDWNFKHPVQLSCPIGYHFKEEPRSFFEKFGQDYIEKIKQLKEEESAAPTMRDLLAWQFALRSKAERKFSEEKFPKDICKAWLPGPKGNRCTVTLMENIIILQEMENGNTKLQVVRNGDQSFLIILQDSELSGTATTKLVTINDLAPKGFWKELRHYRETNEVPDPFMVAMSRK